MLTSQPLSSTIDVLVLCRAWSPSLLYVDNAIEEPCMFIATFPSPFWCRADSK